MSSAVQLELAKEVARYYADPLGFVYFAWRWGGPGFLKDEPAPDENQIEFLRALGEEVKGHRAGDPPGVYSQPVFDGVNPVLPIQMAESSGHGTGKGVLGAWICWWILSTRPYSIGTVTAGTYDQLE